MVIAAVSVTVLGVVPSFRQYLRRRRLRGRIDLPIKAQILDSASSFDRDIDVQLATRALCTIAKALDVSPACLRLSDVLAGEYFENLPWLGLLSFDDEWDRFTTGLAEFVETERGWAIDEAEAMRLLSWETLADVLVEVDSLVRVGSKTNCGENPKP